MLKHTEIMHTNLAITILNETETAHSDISQMGSGGIRAERCGHRAERQQAFRQAVRAASGMDFAG